MSVRTEVLMGTLVTVDAVRAGADAAIDRAFEWFYQIEQCCTRFDDSSELMRLSVQIGTPVRASEMLFEAVRFALTMAEVSGGAFDPTIGHHMATRGFNREHRSGRIARTLVHPEHGVSYRDVEVDPERNTITLRRPLVLDLAAVAKGLAVDMAARELQPFEDFAIDAGGDLYFAGRNPKGRPWSVGLRHPRCDGGVIEALCVSDKAVCTSGDYERHAPDGGHHILDPRTGAPATAVASVTVIAPTAMLADALATAVFVLGPIDGIDLLERVDVDGLIVTPELERHETAGFRRYVA